MPRDFSESVSREICHCHKQRITTLVCTEVVVEDLRPHLKKKTNNHRIFNLFTYLSKMREIHIEAKKQESMFSRSPYFTCEILGAESTTKTSRTLASSI